MYPIVTIYAESYESKARFATLGSFFDQWHVGVDFVEKSDMWSVAIRSSSSRPQDMQQAPSGIGFGISIVDSSAHCKSSVNGRV